MERGVGKGKGLAMMSSVLSTMRDLPKRCPRCDSTNTKFCYYNNYSQSQPRHFCRACRRYWTEGGTLRNVPQGGGTHHRKVKRPRKSCASSSSSSSSSSSFAAGASDTKGLDAPVTVVPPPPPPPPPLYFGDGMMAALFQPLIQTGPGLMASFRQAQYSQPILPAGFVNIPIHSQLPPPPPPPPQFEPIMTIPQRFLGSDHHRPHQMHSDHNISGEFITGSGSGSAAGGTSTHDHQEYSYWNINSELNDGGDGGPPRPPTP